MSDWTDADTDRVIAAHEAARARLRVVGETVCEAVFIIAAIGVGMFIMWVCA
jgi:hypothetical protein